MASGKICIQELAWPGRHQGLMSPGPRRVLPLIASQFTMILHVRVCGVKGGCVPGSFSL